MARTPRHGADANAAPLPTELRDICCALAVVMYEGAARVRDTHGERSAASIAASTLAAATRLRPQFVQAMLRTNTHNATGAAGEEQFNRMFDSMLRRPELIPYAHDWLRLVPQGHSALLPTARALVTLAASAD